MERLLRINLTDKDILVEEIPEKYALFGGRALTSAIVADEVDPLCDPLGPKNAIVMAPGLLSGTPLSSSSRISIGFKSPLTGGIKESNGGGQTGARMAQLGYRGVIIQGAPPMKNWQLLIIGEDGVAFETCNELAGLGTFETARRLFERFGKKVVLQVIGPAGELLMNISGICNTDVEGRPSRICARGAGGAVFGSKRIKAIVYQEASRRSIPNVDDALWRASGKTYHKGLRESHATSVMFPQYGTAHTLEVVNKLGGLPIRNFSRGADIQTDHISGMNMRDIIMARGGQTTHSCMTGCAIQCSNVYVNQQGQEMASSMEFETNGLLGSNLEIFDFDHIAQFTHICNDLGVDTIETGGALGVAMEAGLLKFGDADAVLHVLNDEVRHGTAMGRIVGAGAGTAGRVLGVRRVPVVKNQTMSAYDPRAIKGNGVTYCSTAMGADHTCGNTVFANVDHLDPAAKVTLSRDLQIAVSLLDMLGFCIFARGVYAAQTETFRDLFNARMGTQFSVHKMKRFAVAVILQEIDFNRRAGLGPETDRLPEWMVEEALPPHNSRFDVPYAEIDRIWESYAMEQPNWDQLDD